MDWTKVNKGTFDDFEIPETVYKYRDWEKEHHDRFIKNREAFMSPPSLFFDKKDCKNPVRYDLLTDKQCLEYSIHVSKRENPSFTRQMHRKNSRLWAKRKLFKNEKYLSQYQEDYNHEYDKRQGVLSLTANPCIDKMWKEYANNDEGFCIGYNSKIMFNYLGGGCKVGYLDELPITLPEPFMHYQQISYNRLYVKELKWDYEEEYRTNMFWKNPASLKERQIPLPIAAFKEIILGSNVSEKNSFFFKVS